MRSMPQMGTTQVVGDTGELDDYGNPVPKYFAWWQWWLRGRTIQAPVVFPTVALVPGDKVSCCVTLRPPDQPDPGDRHHVQFFLRVNGVGSPVMLAPPPTNDPSDTDGPRRVPATGPRAGWVGRPPAPGPGGFSNGRPPCTTVPTATSRRASCFRCRSSIPPAPTTSRRASRSIPIRWSWRRLAPGRSPRRWTSARPRSFASWRNGRD